MRMLIVITAILLLAACGNNAVNDSTAAVDAKPPATPGINNEPDQVESADQDEVVAEEEEQTDHDKTVAEGFLKICMQGSDRDEKQTFIEENANPDLAQLFAISCLSISGDGFESATVSDAVDFPLNDGSDGKLYLISGDKEIVLLLRNGELGWIYEPGRDEFNEMRSKF